MLGGNGDDCWEIMDVWWWKCFWKCFWSDENVLKLMCGICCVSSMNIVKTTEFKWLNNICELYLKKTVLMKVMAQLNEIQMPELPWQFVERKMKRFREGGMLVWIYAIELENTQVTVSLQRPKGYCLSGNKECTRKGSIKLIVSVLGELGLTLGDNITELSINVSLALVGIIRSQKARGQVTASKKPSEQNRQNSHHCQNWNQRNSDCEEFWKWVTDHYTPWGKIEGQLTRVLPNIWTSRRMTNKLKAEINGLNRKLWFLDQFPDLSQISDPESIN